MPANTTTCQPIDPRGGVQTWTLDKCTKCLCLGGVLLCSVNTCPPLTCSNPIQKTGECCPECPTVVLLSAPQRDRSLLQTSRHWSCIDSNENYRQHGAKWRETDCLHCVCEDGDVNCFNHESQCPKFVCKNEVRRKGECCPFCLDYLDLPLNLSSAHLNSTFFFSGEFY